MDLNTILTEAQDNSITNGWDVICAMDVSQINKLLAQKFQREDRGGLAYHIAITSKIFSDTVSLDAYLGPPELSFILNEDSRANMVMEIKSGTLTMTYFDAKGQHTKTVDLAGKGGKITAGVDLTKLEGKVKDQGDKKHDVVVELGSGTFGLNFDVAIGLPPLYKAPLADEIKQFFTSKLNNADYSLGTLIYNQANIRPELIPVSFDFKTAQTADGSYGVLQLFINTQAGGKGVKREINGLITSSIIPDGYSSVLIISSRIIFQDILLQEYRNQLDQGMTAISTNNSPITSAYYLEGAKKISIDDYRAGDNRSGWKGFSFHLDDYKVRSESGDLYTRFNRKFTIDYWSVQGYGNYQTTAWGKAYVYLGIQQPKVDLPIDANQIISFNNDNNFSVDVKSDGSLQIDAKHMKSRVKDHVDGELPNLNVSLNSISAFALSNLLFPNDHILNFSLVKVPGDMMIFGTVRSKL